MKVKPMKEYYVVKAFKEEKKDGILIVPDSNQEPVFYSILEVPEHSELSVGDKVILSRFSGRNFEIDGEELLIVKLADILAIVKLN